MEDNNQQNMPLLCRNGCGFYGSPNFDDLCSKCHRDQIVQAERRSEQQHQQQAQEHVKQVDSLVDAVTAVAAAASSAPSSAGSQSPPRRLCAEDQRVLDEVADALVAAGSGLSVSKPSPSLAETPSSVKEDSPCLPPGPELPTASTDSTDASSVTSSLSSTPKAVKKNRCVHCNKRVGLTGFSCRCGGTFCSLHRYSDAHECSFDYRATGQQEIRKANPQILCSKIQKI